MTIFSFQRQMNCVPYSNVAGYVRWGKQRSTLGKTMSAPGSQRPKGKLNRRPGACEPCRKHKIKCTGGEPCLQCQKKKRGKNRETCWYDPKHDPANRVRKAGLKKSKRSTSQGNVECGIGADDEVSSSEESASNGLGTGCPSADDDLGPYGMYRCISQFREMSGAATRLSSSVAVDRCSGTDAFELNTDEAMLDDRDLIKDRPDHALSYFIPTAELQKVSSSLQQLAWRAINTREFYLDKGHTYAAYSSQGMLARHYHRALKAHQMQRTQRRNDAAHEAINEKIYNLIVDLEIQIKMHLGTTLEPQIRPHKQPVSQATSGKVGKDPLKKLEASRTQYRQTALQVLTLLPDYDNDVPSQELRLELEDLFQQLILQQSSFVNVTTVTKDKQALTAVADYQMEHLSFAMMLACRLGTTHVSQRDVQVQEVVTKVEGTPQSTSGTITEPVCDSSTVVGLCRQILEVFALFASSVTIAKTQCWTRSFAAFSAAAIMSIELLQSSSPAATDMALVDTTLEYFRIATREQCSDFSGLAYAQLDKLYTELIRKVGGDIFKAAKKMKRQPLAASNVKVSPSSPKSETGSKRKRADGSTSVPGSAKRTKTETGTRLELPTTALTYGQNEESAGISPDSAVVNPSRNTPSYNYVYHSSAPSSATTSFGSSLPIDAPISVQYIPHVVHNDYLHDSFPSPDTSQYSAQRIAWRPPYMVPYPPLRYEPYVDTATVDEFIQQHPYGVDPGSAHPEAHPPTSSSSTIQHSAWQANQSMPSWNGNPHPHNDSRRNSGFNMTQQAIPYNWPNGMQPAAQVPYQHVYESNPSTEFTGKAPQYLTTTTPYVQSSDGTHWISGEQYAHDNRGMEAWWAGQQQQQHLHQH